MPRSGEPGASLARTPTKTGQAPFRGEGRRADGWITIGVTAEDPFWRSLCRVLGLDEETAAIPFTERVARSSELRPVVVAAVRPWKREELLDELRAADVPAGPVLDQAGMVDLEHLRERGSVVDDGDGRPAFGPLLRMPGARTGPPPPAPALDAHQGETFRSPLRP